VRGAQAFCTRGSIADLGTGTRIGPAWMAAAMPDSNREFFAGESRLVWTEAVLPDLANSLLVGTRR
jgi:hypothetical protein